MNISPISKYEKIFTPLQIVLKKRKNSISTNIYSVLNNNGKKIGKFALSDDGYVSDLVVKRKFRRKKTGLDVIFSIKQFITDECKKRNLEYFTFFAKENNKFNLKRLYEHLGAEYLGDDAGYQFVAIVDPKQKTKILQHLNTLETLGYFKYASGGIMNLFG